MQHFTKTIIAHKTWATMGLVTFLGLTYFTYAHFFPTKTTPTYKTAAAEKGTLIVSVSGSGQVSASNQIDIKSKVSGDVVYLGVQAGQIIKAGTLIAQLDYRDAAKGVRDAQANLDAAKLSLEKLQKPADTLTLLEAENALSKAKESKQNSEDDLKKTYEDGLTAISNAFLDLPSIITGLNDMLFSTDKNLSGSGQWNIDYYTDSVKSYDDAALQYKKDVSDAYAKARMAYDQNLSDYKVTSRFSETSTIEKLINETYETTQALSEAVKDANNLIQFYKDKTTEHSLKPNALADTHLATLSTYTSKTNTHLSNLLSAQNTIKNDKENIVNDARTIAEKTESLSKLQSGAEPLDIQSQELSVKQRQNALLDAQEKLRDYFIRAQFDGVIAKLNIKKGDSLSASAAVATLITNQRIAEISLNEVDVAKISVGQKVNLTFDAVPLLTITGVVSEIDAIGTTTQGVVTYAIKISFDTQDDRVKPGMSVSASIITNVITDALLVPNAAVKSNATNTYVELLINGAPIQKTVDVGASNDTMTEIKSGISEGDQVITQTITGTAPATANQQSTGFRIPGLGSGGIRTGGGGR